MPDGTSTPQSPLVLILDIGSSSSRALVYDSTATLIANSLVREKSAFHVAADGTAVDDPAALRDRVSRCIDGALAALGSHAAQIGAVGCATYASNVLGLDAHGQPCTPIYTYADTRSADAADRLRAQLDEAAIWQRTGCPLRTSYLPAVFTWLAEEQPTLFRAARRWVSVGEWLLETFLGRGSITYSQASWTGLLDRTTLTWDAQLLDALPVDAAQLGALADVDAPFVGLKDEWARRWPVLANVPWFSPVGDGAAANVGSGCTDPRFAALSVGTSGAVRIVVKDNPIVPPGLWCYRVDRSHPLLGGATSEGGSVLTWALRTLSVEATALDQYLNAPAGAQHGLAVLPFVTGERSPGWSGDVRATISGITLTTTALDVARAALEGVTYRWALIAQLLRGALSTTPTIVVSGGGLKYVPSWAQLIADAIGWPVAVSAEPETTSRGAALLALRSIGLIRSLDELQVGIVPTHQPDPERHARHLAAIEQQAALYKQVIA